MYSVAKSERLLAIGSVPRGRQQPARESKEPKEGLRKPPANLDKPVRTRSSPGCTLI